MITSVIVPWGRPSGPAGEVRESVWNRIRPLWEATGLNLIVAADPLFTERGKFAVGRAINNAVRLAPPEYDRFVCFGADFLPCPRTAEWAAEELEHQPWTLLFDRGAGFDPERTEEFIATGYLPNVHDLPHEIFASPCVGPIGFRRDVFEAVGGFDERYEGWAYEDVDLWMRLQRDAPRTQPPAFSGMPLVQFWHPTDHHDLSQDNPNVRLFEEKWCG